MLLRNFNQHNGHCSGSRDLIDQILPHHLVSKSVVGVNAGPITPDCKHHPVPNWQHVFYSLCGFGSFQYEPALPWQWVSLRGSRYIVLASFAETSSEFYDQGWQIKQASHFCSRWRDKEVSLSQQCCLWRGADELNSAVQRQKWGSFFPMRPNQVWHSLPPSNGHQGPPHGHTLLQSLGIAMLNKNQ